MMVGSFFAFKTSLLLNVELPLILAVIIQTAPLWRRKQWIQAQTLSTKKRSDRDGGYTLLSLHWLLSILLLASIMHQSRLPFQLVLSIVFSMFINE
jgi:hypothetical protein